MKIVIINGSYRKNGTTAQILKTIEKTLLEKANIEVLFYHVADLQMHYCTGCYHCYKSGTCVFKDDIHTLSKTIATCDGLILGSPTLASNVSAQMKTIIDRGHFIIEQLLHNKYAMSVATYENHGGKNVAKILNQLLSQSGAQISNTIVYRSDFERKPQLTEDFKQNIQMKAIRFYNDIFSNKQYRLQKLKHKIIFNIGIKRFVKKHEHNHQGTIQKWNDQKIHLK